MQIRLLQPCKQLKTSQSNQNNLYLKEKSWRNPALLKYLQKIGLYHLQIKKKGL